MEAWGTRVAVSWVQALAARLVPSLVSSLLVLGLVPGLVSSVIATLAPLRHASNLGGPFNLCSLLSAVSLGPPEGATTHDYGDKLQGLAGAGKVHIKTSVGPVPPGEI